MLHAVMMTKELQRNVGVGGKCIKVTLAAVASHKSPHVAKCYNSSKSSVVYAKKAAAAQKPPSVSNYHPVMSGLQETM